MARFLRVGVFFTRIRLRVTAWRRLAWAALRNAAEGPLLGMMTAVVKNVYTSPYRLMVGVCSARNWDPSRAIRAWWPMEITQRQRALVP